MVLDNWFIDNQGLYGRVNGNPKYAGKVEGPLCEGDTVRGYTLGKPCTVKVRRVPFNPPAPGDYIADSRYVPVGERV